MAKAPPAPNLQETAAEAGALGRTSGKFVEAISRDEVLATHGKGDLALYEKLLGDEQVMSTFTQRRQAVIARETKVEPGGDDPQSIAAAKFLEDNLAAISWDRTCYRMLAALMYGRGVGECMFDFDKQLRVVLKGIKVRRAARFKFDVGGRLWLQRETGTPEQMPDFKFWTFTCGADDDDDPYGRGLGHHLYWPVWFKRNGLRFWSLFLERFAQPLPKAIAPPGSNDADRKKLLGMLQAFITSGSIVVPRGVDVELIQAARSSGGDYEQFCARMDAAITKIILTQTMTTENGSSLSQAEVHERVAQQGAKSDSDLLTESFCAGPARWLTEWNFPGAKVPLVYRDFAISRDLSASAERDSKLGALGFRPTSERIAEVYGDGYVEATPTGIPDGMPAAASGELEATPAAPSESAGAAGVAGVQLTGTDLASIVTVNEGRASNNLPPLKLGDGSADPDGLLPIAEFQAKRAAKAAVTGEAAGAAVAGTSFAEAAPRPKVRDASEAVEDLVGGDGWRKVLGPEVGRIEALLDGASSLDEFRDRLGELAMAEPSQLVDGLSRVLFAARVQGDVGAADGEVEAQ